MKKLLTLVIAFSIISCVPKPSPTSDRLKVISAPGILYSTPKYTIYGREFQVSNSYTSHIVWVEDKDGNLLQLATH